jgi:hypothetical protein
LRKGAAIFLLVIHFYNFIGYKAIFAYLDKQATDHLISRLDKGKYQEDELIEVKIPYQSLYAPNWTDYARFDGEIEINGSHYNFVKRKFANDTLYLLCIPNNTSNRLQSAEKVFWSSVAQTADNAHERSKSAASNLLKCFSGDWNVLLNHYDLACPAGAANKYIVALNKPLSDVFIPAFFKPPKATA